MTQFFSVLFHSRLLCVSYQQNIFLSTNYFFSHRHSLKFRPIALIVSVSYCTWVYKTFYSNYKIYISPELVARCKDFYENASNLRKNKPHVFCGFVSSILFLVSIIGHAIDGAYLLIGEINE